MYVRACGAGLRILLEYHVNDFAPARVINVIIKIKFILAESYSFQ